MTEVFDYDYLTVQEASNLSGYHQRHLRRLIASGELRAVKRGRDWFILRSSLVDYIEQQASRGGKTGPKPGR